MAVYMLPELKELFGSFTGIFEDSGISADYCKSVIKVIGIAYFTEIISALCRDAGESAIGAKLELAGKVMALAITVPAIKQLMSVIKEALALI